MEAEVAKAGRVVVVENEVGPAVREAAAGWGCEAGAVAGAVAGWEGAAVVVGTAWEVAEGTVQWDNLSHTPFRPAQLLIGNGKGTGAPSIIRSEFPVNFHSD